jgi:SAM-dependent methyltransferase
VPAHRPVIKGQERGACGDWKEKEDEEGDDDQLGAYPHAMNSKVLCDGCVAWIGVTQAFPVGQELPLAATLRHAGHVTDDADQIIGLYERHARSFDRQRKRRLFERPWLERFLALVPENGSILDLGCGSGEPIARYLVETGYAVTGVDSAAAMIALCRDRFPDHTWLVADMRKLALGRTFDGILAWNSLFHLRPADQRAVFPIFAQHERAGAPLLFTSGPRSGEAMGEFEGEPLYHASLDPDEYRALLARQGFEVVSYTPEDPECGLHTVWLARRK